jgi:hypothetical protein
MNALPWQWSGAFKNSDHSYTHEYTNTQTREVMTLNAGDSIALEKILAARQPATVYCPSDDEFDARLHEAECNEKEFQND